jgi:hypothetical protein
LQHIECSGCTGIGWYSNNNNNDEDEDDDDNNNNNNTFFFRISGTCELYTSWRKHPVYCLFRA